MILVAVGLLGLAIVDLARWSPERVAGVRAALAVVAGVVASSTLVSLGGGSGGQVVAVAVASALVLAVWSGFDYLPMPSAGGGLVWLMLVLAVLFGFSGSIGPITGPLARWYENLPFGFIEDVSVDQFVVALTASLFAMASANRVVRLVLDAAGVSRQRSEGTLKGGRLLGPLERLIVFAALLAANPATAAIVVTGKGLLRFPEIRGEVSGPGPEQVTEYFLIGTFTSIVVAVLLGLLVLAAG